MNANRSNDDGDVAANPSPADQTVLMPTINLQLTYEAEKNSMNIDMSNIMPVDPAVAYSFPPINGAPSAFISVAGYQPPSGDLIYHEPFCPTQHFSVFWAMIRG